MKKIALFIIAVIIFCSGYSQTTEPVYIKNNKFYEGCNEFYPKVLVYNVSIVEHWISPINTFWVCPWRDYSPDYDMQEKHYNYKT